jgi:hypothetical protein
MADKPVLMEATQAFSCTLDAYGRVPFAVGAGEVFAADDEVVRRHPGNFRPVRVRDSSTVRRPLPQHPGAVETATAAPGELRHLTRPAAPPVTAARKSKPAAAPTATEPSEV